MKCVAMVHEHMAKKLLKGAISLSLLVPLGLISCGNEDRMVTVDCGPPSANVAIEMGNLGTSGLSFGLLNTPHFVPGTVIQLTPPVSQKGRGSGMAVYVLETSDEDFLPPRPEAWFNKVVGAQFDVEMDEDVRFALQPLNVDWQKTIIASTEILIRNARRSSLREPLRLINSDAAAVETVRRGKGTSRFALVSEVSYGNRPFLYYSMPPALAYNLIEVSRFYLHIKYACSALAELGSTSQSAAMSIPIVFIQIPVKYDPLSRMVTIDTNPIDFMSFDLVPTSM
jgi:hypothetical protein